MTKEMEKLCNEKAQLLAEGNALKAEGKMKELEVLNAKIKEKNYEIEVLETFEEEQKGVAVNNKATDNKKFKNFAEQISAIVKAEKSKGKVIDERLFKNELSGGLNTNNDADGGYAIQKDFIGVITERAFETSPILSRLRTMSITNGSNSASWVVPDDSEDATKEGVVVAGGVQAYWMAEGTTVPKSKPKFKPEEVKLGKVGGFCWVTEEMLQDAGFMAQFIEDSFVEAVEGAIVQAVLNGTGEGEDGQRTPNGIMTSQALVEVPATDSSKVTAQDFLNMKARMRKKNWANAVWVVHPDLEADLPLMKDEDGNLMFIAAGGLNGATTDTLLGRPVVYDEFVASKGSKGDILLADFSEYLLIKKGEERKDWSMHVAFLTDEQVFRIVMRVNGKPMRNNTYAVRNSTNRRGAFVTLGARGL